MQAYQFEKIYSRMAKQYGKLQKGQEEALAMVFFTLESNVMKVHRAHPDSNSRRLREAIGLVLFDIKDRLDGAHSDTDNIRNEANERLEEALLMSFDPFTNDEVREILGEMNSEQLHEYYAEPVRCLLRIKDSVDLWEKNMGSNGYFDFMEGFMGDKVRDDKINYTIMMGSEEIEKKNMRLPD